MPELYRVTVVAASDRPLGQEEVDAWATRLTTALEGEVAALPLKDALTVRSDQQGFDVVVLLEAESADDARARAEEGALAGMTEARLAGAPADGDPGAGDPGAGDPVAGGGDDIKLELVRAEPAYAP